MSFCLERISAEDSLKFGLHEVDKQFPLASIGRWVIDHQAEVYLRYMFYDKENASRKSFCFLWQQKLYLLQLECHGQALPNHNWSSKWQLLSAKEISTGRFQLLGIDNPNFIQALKDALRIYRDGSLNPGYQFHVAEFDF